MISRASFRPRGLCSPRRAARSSRVSWAALVHSIARSLPLPRLGLRRVVASTQPRRPSSARQKTAPTSPWRYRGKPLGCVHGLFTVAGARLDVKDVAQCARHHAAPPTPANAAAQARHCVQAHAAAEGKPGSGAGAEPVCRRGLGRTGRPAVRRAAGSAWQLPRLRAPARLPSNGHGARGGAGGVGGGGRDRGGPPPCCERSQPAGDGRARRACPAGQRQRQQEQAAPLQQRRRCYSRRDWQGAAGAAGGWARRAAGPAACLPGRPCWPRRPCWPSGARLLPS
jgi:hypothetical protein